MPNGSLQPAGLLQAAADAVEGDRVKGPGGAFEALAAFLRMRSLKNTPVEERAREEIIAAAPRLMEALAEAPASEA